MPDNDHDDGNGDNPKARENPNARTITAILVIAAILFIGLAFIAWYFVNEHSERIKFLTVNTLSLFILVAIVTQACIYWAQRNVMAEHFALTKQALQIAERAYLAVHSIETDLTGKRRIFVRIENTGKLPAEQIKTRIKMVCVMPKHRTGAADPNQPFRIFDDVQVYGKMKLFPGNFKIVTEIDVGNRLSAVEGGLIGRGHGELYLWGYIDYLDGFDSWAQTQFAFFYIGEENLWFPNNPVWATSAYKDIEAYEDKTRRDKQPKPN